MSSDEHQDINQEINKLLQTLQSVQLATLNSQQQPEISYTPFIKLQKHYYIFISDLATHTQNLRDHPLVSIMFIEDEARCKNVFARKRLILECQSIQLDRNDQSWKIIMQEFERSRGNTINVLKSLPDFYLFQLDPQKGSFVKGFGNAYALSGVDLSDIKQITGK